MRIPTATYRIQFGQALGFDRARSAVSFLDLLGISDLYSSPICEARPGSEHGYDVTNHEQVNPELGGEKAFVALARELRALGMGILLDIVPNHMCVAGDSNSRWLDVLQNGPAAESTDFFDIDWNPPKPELAGRILLPILPDQFGHVLAAKELSLCYRPEGFAVLYAGARYPLTANSWVDILSIALGLLKQDASHPEVDELELESILRALERLPAPTDLVAARVRERRHELPIITRRVASLHAESAVFRSALEATLAKFVVDETEPGGFEALGNLLSKQCFRLSSWRVAAHEINYRRFFDINELAAIRVENRKVFEAVHSLPFRLAKDGHVTGLRIDHVDGLYDPLGYLDDLQRGWSAHVGANASTKDAYVVVEKILGPAESLPAEWPVAGTTGYEFMNLVTGVLVDGRRVGRLRTLARGEGDADRPFSDIAYECKKLILRTSLAAELTVLARRLDRISEQDVRTRDFTRVDLQDALAEVAASFPFYRTYIRFEQDFVSPADRAAIDLAVHAARTRGRGGVHQTVFDFVRSVLLLEDPDGLTARQRKERRDFVMRFQQLTGPVAAKGVEDTAFYQYFPLAALEEVGGNPESTGTSLAQFHANMAERARRARHALSATDTHDAKRSEDVRARLAVLSEIPEEWDRAVERWRTLNRGIKSSVCGVPAPDDDDEYLFYQTVVGIWPPAAAAPSEDLSERVSAYMTKAVHEAKRHSSWTNPNGAYDEAVAAFVGAALDPTKSAAFLRDLGAFVNQIARPGFWNGLAQVLLKIAAPGVPDFFQGAELWRFHLVDPDNRKAVDFQQRHRVLEEVLHAFERDPVSLANALLASPEDGRIKMLVTAIGLRYRRANSALFRDSDYWPCDTQGPRASQVVAFARVGRGKGVIAVTGRFYLRFRAAADLPVGACWAGTRVAVPEELRTASFRDVITGRRLVPESGGAFLAVDRVLEHFPVALVEAKREREQTVSQPG